ncbi:hypothetical protein MNB_SV-13-702 [hydrothermal vent metagenome]|uniref:Stringent starvation protein B n=1 Tax=hydrothermal vent metagenome TaxID=652676 RepID=A0A1W1CT70_9ZZZZ
MPHTLFQTPEYTAIIQEHISQVISYLFSQDTDFSVVCEVKHITFAPELPLNIHEQFKETVLFSLTGYTRESAGMNKEEDYFSFEAGFGSENFGSRLMMPLLSIKQIFVDDNPMMLNFVEYEALETSKKALSKSSEKNSMEALLNNPQNKKLRKKSLKPKA